jgi:hypothetical protein
VSFIENKQGNKKNDKTNGRAPVDLRSQINLPAPEDDLEKQVEQTVNVYNLRRGRVLV